MTAIVLDIETAANSEMPEELSKSLMDNVKPDARIKDPQKVAQSIADNQAKMIEDFPLSPLTGKIVCAVCAIVDYERMSILSWHSAAGPKEINNLRLIQDVAMETGPGKHIDRIVTFNGKSFDIPFIIARMIALGMTVPATLERCLTDRNVHTDLRNILTGGDRYARGTLPQWAISLGVDPHDVKFDKGSDIADLVATQSWKEIEEKCIQDVVMSTQLFFRMKRVMVL